MKLIRDPVINFEVDAKTFENLLLPGEFLLAEIKFTDEDFVDAIGREAVAMTRVIGKMFWIVIRSRLSETENSVSVYHEVLEAATVASIRPPLSVAEFNEADFEREARAAHERLGTVSPSSLKSLLQSFGFGGK